MSETNEAEVLEQEAETAFIMGSGGKWDEAIRADCNRAGVTRNLRDVARAVAAKARELDRARGGTLLVGDTERLMKAVRDGTQTTELAKALDRHMAAQGRTIAAERERADNLAKDRDRWQDAAQQAGRERDYWRSEAAAHDVGATAAESDRKALRSRTEELERLLERETAWKESARLERDEARATIAERDARIAELVAEVSVWRRRRNYWRRLARDNRSLVQEWASALGLGTGDGYDKAEAIIREKCAAESALATLRQAVAWLVEEVEQYRATGDGSSLFLARDSEPGPEVLNATRLERLLEVYDATPTEHPDTAKAARWEANAREFAARPCCPSHERHNLSVLPCLNPYRDTLRAINASLTVCREMRGDSGPSGGGEVIAEGPGFRWTDAGNGYARLETLPTTQQPACQPEREAGEGCGAHGYPLRNGKCAGSPDVAASDGGDAIECPICGSTGPAQCGHGDTVAGWGKPTPPDVAECMGEACQKDAPTVGSHLAECPASGSMRGPDASEATPTPEEDWRHVEAVLDACADENTTWPELDVAGVALEAFRRLKAEPRRAAEAMRKAALEEAEDRLFARGFREASAVVRAMKNEVAP